MHVCLPHQTGSASQIGVRPAPPLSGAQGGSLEDAQRRLLKSNSADLEKSGVGSVRVCAHTRLNLPEDNVPVENYLSGCPQRGWP